MIIHMLLYERISFTRKGFPMNTMHLISHKIIKSIPLDQNCFATHNGPCEGVGLRMYVTEDDHIVGLCRTKKCHQGYDNTIHGGIISTYFDEVLWYATTLTDERLIAMTVEMTVKYLKPLMTEQDIRIVAKPMTRDGRHIYVEGHILDQADDVVAKAKSHFITLKPDHQINDPKLYDTLKASDVETPKEVWF